MKVGVVGLGAMGAPMARNLHRAGLLAQVWNRSADKARKLQADGARAFDDPAAALTGIDRVHLSLADDASVDAVLEPLAGRMPPSTWIVDHTTTAAGATGERAARWASRSQRYVHAPVFMSPANCREGTGLMLISGARTHHDALLPALQQMTGQVVYLGEDPSRAAAFKLFGNLTLLGILGVLGDVNRLAHALGIPTGEAFSLFQHFNPGQSLPARAARIESADVTQPSFEVSMARKDVRLMIDEARRGGQELLVMPAVAAMFDAAIARGQGALDTAITARVAD